MFCCPNPSLVRHCQSVLGELGKKTLRLGIPQVVWDVLLQLLQDYTSNRTHTLPQAECIRQAVEDQLRIGAWMFPRGFLSSKWVDLLRVFSTPFPQRKMAGFLRLLWLDFVEPMWMARNEISHQRRNFNALFKAVTVSDWLHWYLDNPQVLSHGDQQTFLSYTRDLVA
jgi:hypothetical protein